MVVPPARSSANGHQQPSRLASKAGITINEAFANSFKLGEPPSMSQYGGPSGPTHELLSERRAPRLDMSTVETRQSDHSSRGQSRRSRPHDLEEAPTFRPSREEFADPVAYIQSITARARPYGIAKIVPPTGWNPSFSIDTRRFHFRTRKQELNSVEGMTRVNLSYLDQLAKFHKMHGTSLNRFPSVDKKPLDLYRLKKAVEMRGGFERVCKGKKWAEIGRDLGYSGKIMSSLSTSLKNSYGRWLQPFEDYLRVNKPGVQHQWEMESGSPIASSSNSPHPLKSEPRNSSPHVNGRIPDPSPARSVPSTDQTSSSRAALALNTLVPVGSGFTPVNPGGFVPINNGSGFTAINGHAPPIHKPEKPKLSPHRPREPLTRDNGEANGHPYQPGPENGLKRARSPDGTIENERAGTSQGSSGIENGERRSKRVRRDQPPTIAGSNMTMHRAAPSHKRLPLTKIIPGIHCDTCGGGHDRNWMITCDSCENVFHKECLNQPSFVKPEEWSCTKCLVGMGEFGFEDGEIYSLSSFQEKARQFKESHFSSDDATESNQKLIEKLTEDDVEREFWRLVESLEDTVTVEYGADVHSTTHGSGFPTMERDPKDPYSRDPWNLNNLPFQADSLFRYIKSDISGMTNPWLYVGMCFSTFCWHNEDHYTYSANYHHFGETKTWYGIPGEDAEKFEEAMRQAVPDLFERQPDLLFQLVTLLPPEQLKAAGVRVFALDQRAGEFVITFPQAYHAGFNHGFNFNEAVNFAPPDWEPYGQAGVLRLQTFRRAPCFSHEELLITAMSEDTSLKTSRWLARALSSLRDRELKAQKYYLDQHTSSIRRLGITCSHMAPDCGSECPHIARIMGPEQADNQDLTCSFCKAYCFMSFMWCRDSRTRYCLDHVDRAEGDHCCGTTEPRVEGRHQYWIRYDRSKLVQLVDKVVERARAPEAWQEKYDKVLSEGPSPNLKVLKTLAAEGERIPFPLAHFSELKRFVERCTEWVEEATYYITRKQLSRKKNEKSWRRGSTRNAEVEEREKELRNVANIPRLLSEAEKIGFDCPEIALLREKYSAIQRWQQEAHQAMAEPTSHSIHQLEDMAEVGKSFTVDLSEVEELARLVTELEWRARVRAACIKPPNRTQFELLVAEGEQIGIPEQDRQLSNMTEQLNAARDWEMRATESLAAEKTDFPQLVALASQGEYLPISGSVREAVREVVEKQQDAEDKIRRLYSAVRRTDFRQRPFYREVRDALEAVQGLSNKPAATPELEKDLKRHEDWMRKGKKLFGKANAPLHILQQYMDYVDTRNKACFSLEDKPRTPVEPPSREASPDESGHGQFALDSDSQSERIYCLCRSKEAGMMVECESCRSWYHGKCLKIARGKVKEKDKFTCPICDYRVRIPRDAARPRLEELHDWQDEIPTLPFQPEEEDCLNSIIDTAQTFQNHLQSYLNPIMPFSYAEITELRHFLRKLEGADVHLAKETNYFKQEIHHLAPVAPEPPPLTEKSLSTRKPRPTKMQKLMAQHGVNDPNDLPPELRPQKKDVFARDPPASRPRLEPKLPLTPSNNAHGQPTTLTSAVTDGPRSITNETDYSRYGVKQEGPIITYQSPATHYPTGPSDEMVMPQPPRFSQSASFGTVQPFGPAYAAELSADAHPPAHELGQSNGSYSNPEGSAIESGHQSEKSMGYLVTDDDKYASDASYENMLDNMFDDLTAPVDDSETEETNKAVKA